MEVFSHFKGGFLDFGPICFEQSTNVLFLLAESSFGGVIKQMKKLVCDLFWGKGDGHGCINLVYWGKTPLPLKYEGLGLGVYIQRNNALLLTWLWRFTREDGDLWRQVVVKPWFGIAKFCAKFKSFSKLEMNRGSHIRLWKDI